MLKFLKFFRFGSLSPSEEGYPFAIVQFLESERQYLINVPQI
jgi:hypothetical protein